MITDKDVRAFQTAIQSLKLASVNFFRYSQLKRYATRQNLVQKTLTFDVSVTRSNVSNFYLTLSNGQLRIACPSDTDFHSDEVQERLKKMIDSALRHEAKRILPKRLDALAGKHGFSYAEVKINGSRTHWGSCTSRKSINLSYSLLLLPPHLIDYVLLHELCHTLEMSHNQRFWELLDNTCGNRAKSLRQELQNYRML